MNLQLSLSQGDIVNIDSLKSIMVTSKNLSDEPESIKADVKIYKLQPPQRLIRKRLWNEPDTFVISKNEFLQYFPHDEYKDECEKETWPKAIRFLIKPIRVTTIQNWQLKTKIFVGLVCS